MGRLANPGRTTEALRQLELLVYIGRTEDETAQEADWVLPAALDRIRRKLAGSADGDRQMVEILTAVLRDGLSAVESACAEALREGVHSADVVLNILARQREPTAPVTILTPESLRLRHEPVADCARYDSLRRVP